VTARGDIAIRRAEVADAREVARLLHDFNTEFDDPTPGVEAIARRTRELLASGDMTALLAGQPPHGIAVIRFRPSIWLDSLDAYLEELYVAPEDRGRGVGRALLEETMEVARSTGAARIELCTGEDDRAARALYESCGFTNREDAPDGPIMFFYERDL
jgi:ribosomal protein S18 acetylase RimI-like enzyme